MRNIGLPSKKLSLAITLGKGNFRTSLCACFMSNKAAKQFDVLPATKPQRLSGTAAAFVACTARSQELHGDLASKRPPLATVDPTIRPCRDSQPTPQNNRRDPRDMAARCRHSIASTDQYAHVPATSMVPIKHMFGRSKRVSAATLGCDRCMYNYDEMQT